MTPWLTIIGTGEAGVRDLPPSARSIVESADVIFGSKRLIQTLGDLGSETHTWLSPLDDSIEKIIGCKGQKVVILATGDPMHYGIGATLQKYIPLEEMRILPSPSAFSLAAARLGWPLQDVEMISLHGRPTSALSPNIQPGARIIALTEGQTTIGEAAAILTDREFGESTLTVLEHMGGDNDNMFSLTASDYNGQSCANFSTLAIECIAGSGTRFLPRTPGLPDDAFKHDGQITKREVRAITLAALTPQPNALLWDVGAGCGSIAIEWMRAANGARAIAFEQKPERIALIAGNALKLGVPDLDIVQGPLPQTLENQHTPDAIFIGGALTNIQVFETCWLSLKRNGRLVVNAVTLEGEAALASYHEEHGGELIRIDISHVKKIGTKRAMAPRMAVTQWRAQKP